MADSPILPFIDRDFGGDRQRFGLRLGEVGELERLCNAGVAGILYRLSTSQFYHADVRETLRLGLIGGGLSPPDALALIKIYFDGRPLVESLQIAIDILLAHVHGIDGEIARESDRKNRDGAEDASPATSAPIMP